MQADEEGVVRPIPSVDRAPEAEGVAQVIAAPQLAECEEQVRAAALDLARKERIALDVEASGMHAYRAQACTIALASDDGRRTFVVDAIAAPLAPLAFVLGASGPTKIVHDVAFDARLLADRGLTIGRVHDTAIAAQMLGRAATGLASLLESELGLRIEKAMQHHDWRIRPIDAPMLAYIAQDVAHLESLERALWTELEERGIVDAVVEETKYRIDCATAVAAAPLHKAEVAYLRVKGSDRLSEREASALRAVAQVRERTAEARDVPPHKVVRAESLVAIARARPSNPADIRRIAGFAASSPEASALVDELARALATAGETLPEDERAIWLKPPVATAVFKARRARESRLLAWRRAEAKARGVDEQVVLPGHCLKRAAEADAHSVDALALVPGIGAFRVERDGLAIVRALRGDENES